MPVDSHLILGHLRAVGAERQLRLATPGLEARVVEIKIYQQRRFCHTYADMLESRRYGAAARFFLDELYGPADFTQRDQQFARVVPALVKLFPQQIIDTVGALAALHALSEALDTQMALHLSVAPGLAPVTRLSYLRAWQASGRAADREEQIRLTLALAGQLDRLTRNLLVRKSLQLMRRPAQAAGLADLQQFLERGFATFQAMRGAAEFITTIQMREEALAAALFSGSSDVSGLLPDEGRNDAILR